MSVFCFGGASENSFEVLPVVPVSQYCLYSPVGGRDVLLISIDVDFLRSVPNVSPDRLMFENAGNGWTHDVFPSIQFRYQRGQRLAVFPSRVHFSRMHFRQAK